MRTFCFEACQRIPRPQPEVFEFFSNAANLETITPPWLSFHIETPLPIAMRAGALIDYRLRVHGVPLRWRTRITTWNPPHQFVDEQLQGPYRLWHHEHIFEQCNGGTMMRDRVTYAVLGGHLINRLFVRKDLEAIFAYRTRSIAECLQAKPHPQTPGNPSSGRNPEGSVCLRGRFPGKLQHSAHALARR